jgi:choline-sulfatase
MYEDAIRVPLVIAGPGVQSGGLVTTPVSHLDLFQTICEALELESPEQMRGTSLWGLLRGEAQAEEPAFSLSEYHAVGFPASIFAIRSGQYKYVEYVGERPSLFDLEADPLEMHDLVVERPDDAHTRATCRRLRKMLCEVCSPEAVDAHAKADQRVLRRELTENGRLVEELWRVGYEKNPDRLIPQRELAARV